MKFINNIWQFIAHLAYVITQIDELIEQIKTFYEWLFGDDDDDDQQNSGNGKKCGS